MPRRKVGGGMKRDRYGKLRKRYAKCQNCGEHEAVHRWGYCEFCKAALEGMLERVREYERLERQADERERSVVRFRGPRGFVEVQVTRSAAG